MIQCMHMHRDGNQVKAADALQQMAHDLAAANKGTASAMWNRALLHQMAAQGYMQTGQAQITSEHQVLHAPCTIDEHTGLLDPFGAECT